MDKIGIKIIEAIRENKWLAIEYKSQNQDTITKYWIGITDIDFPNRRLIVEMFNHIKNPDNSIDGKIYYDRIISAKVLDCTYYECKKELLAKLDDSSVDKSWLNISYYNSNIMQYLVECNEYDNDPSIKDYQAIDGAVLTELLKYGRVRLNHNQMQEFIHLIYKINFTNKNKEFDYSKLELALSVLSINSNKRKYVIAYKRIYVNFYSQELSIDEKSTINKSFLTDNRRVSIKYYLDGVDEKEFVESFDKKFSYYHGMIEEVTKNFYNEYLDTRADLFIIERKFSVNLIPTINAILKMEEENKLTNPLKAYFGLNLSKYARKKSDPYIVVYDEKTNIDQVMVIYNSMINSITYVQGPPGTGKTTTLMNVVLSAIANNYTCLICSNNNKPINDIYDKFKNFYHKTKKDFYFPILRIGNKEENNNALNKILELYEYAKKEKIKIKEILTEKSKEKALTKYNDLRKMLDDNLNKNQLTDKIDQINRIIKWSKGAELPKKLYTYLDELKSENDKIKEVTNDEVRLKITAAKDNKNYMNYLYYYSLTKIKKLTQSSYQDLIDIANIDNLDEKNKQFNTYLSSDENVKKLINVFPIIITTNLSANKIGTPSQHFDMCIMDEAGQCNIATSLIPIVRAKSLLLVGDQKQLKPVIVLEENIHNRLQRKYQISDEYNYMENSILSLMTKKDPNSCHIILRYHYRCPKKIIDFSNQIFYDNSLKIENKNDANLELVDVKNYKMENIRNAYEAEAEVVVKKVIENGYENTIIITPFNNQANLINKKLKERNINTCKAGTIHSSQGAEASTIIFSSSLAASTPKKTFEWLKNNEEIINVGLTRAKENFIFVGDYDAIKQLDHNEGSIIASLASYVGNNGSFSRDYLKTTQKNNFSNNSSYEYEFYQTLIPFIESYGKYKYERNQPVKNVLKLKDDKYQTYYDKAEFDGVLYNNNVPALIIEIDGAEHPNCQKTIKNDRKKEKICEINGIKLIRIPNFLVYDFQCIVHLLQNVLGEKNIPTLFD